MIVQSAEQSHGHGFEFCSSQELLFGRAGVLNNAPFLHGIIHWAYYVQSDWIRECFFF